MCLTEQITHVLNYIECRAQRIAGRLSIKSQSNRAGALHRALNCAAAVREGRDNNYLKRQEGYQFRVTECRQLIECNEKVSRALGLASNGYVMKGVYFSF